MKKCLFLLTTTLVALSMWAAPVNQATALRKAKSYLANELYAGKVMAPAALNPVLLKAEMCDSKQNQAVYYIYNTSTTYLVVAGDDRAEEILMVGDRPLKDINHLAPAMQEILDMYKEEITFLFDHPVLKVNRPSELNRSLNAVTYGPLLTANWDQESPYNNLCKFTYNNRTYTCLTGCPATSAAMVLYYWKYPASVGTQAAYTSTLDIGSYYSNEVSYTYAALDPTTFDWTNMKDNYSNSSSTASKTAVATLMRYVGQAEKMMYGVTGSGIYTTNSANIVNMFKSFGYDDRTRLVYKSSYNEENWGALIQAELAAGRPMVYLGVSGNSGHAFNVDGYRDSDGKYHVNFGWSGDGNNWYAMNSFTYSGYTFSSTQRAVIGIQPPDGTVPELTVNPTSLTFTATTGETVTKTFTLSGTDLHGAVSVRATGSYYNVSPSTVSLEDAQAGVTVTVTYKPTAVGTHTGEIIVSSTSAESKTVTLEGTATAPAPTINVDPASLSFNTTVGTPVTQTFDLTGVNLTGVVYLSCSGAGFSINKTNVTKTAATNGVTVTVTYSPTTSGNHTGTVTLTSSGAESKTVSLNGTAIGAPTITASPTSLNFITTVGTPVAQTFTVNGENLTGPLTLTLNNGAGIFSINPTTISVAEAVAGKVVTVTYLPTVLGMTNASVTISGGGATAATVTLAGQTAHGYTVGDVNHDDIINIGDVTLLISAVLTSSNDGICVTCADMDENGVIDIADVTALIAKVLNGGN